MHILTFILMFIIGSLIAAGNGDYSGIWFLIKAVIVIAIISCIVYACAMI